MIRLLAPLLALALPLAAEEPDRAALQVLAGSCANCHGPDGHSPGAIPSIAGLPAEETAAKMLAFRDGQDPAATVMPRLMKGYDEAQIRALAEWFERVDP
ncbi:MULTISPECIES: c-type cytochrome [unclassified Paracoccus (in: a-proteobacteria)]|uniref:c-type cytochrome n=1 Tax=unclassified Paracoccus (in: a-proteobacteria) TaxID=2688777 RepID=UPI001600CA16|nr:MULTISPECIES: c-type cytochrome [unclassified Paracoccus (in: a-proteobacteria)]MBB1490178.1 c-type cytochrome [Paracoccus sp. MC1854]MBB1498834.1 c-type cytochrome [Paracoccus sp. MC1862]QQO43765.1 c-type cytochrome [Paracoccus sp. MC1862]